MSKNRDISTEYDSLKDVTEYQKNMYNPGYYVGTGRIPPTVSATGNATPLVVMCFCAALLFLAFGFVLFFSDINITSGGVVKSAKTNKIIALIIMLAISGVFTLFGFRYLKKSKRYYRQKRKMEEEPIDETVENTLCQRTCPKCGETHDIDYPKCPKCKHNYFE